MEAERLPVESLDLGKTLVEAPLLISIRMSESSSVSHSRRAGALSSARAGLLPWNGAKAAGGGGGVGARAGDESPLLHRGGA